MNRLLGQLGEKFTVEIERKRLLECGRDDLAATVEWVAMTCGDGVGFDVLSFHEADDSERFIEVKTTGLGKRLPSTSRRTRSAARRTARTGSASTGSSTSHGTRGSTWWAGRCRGSACWSPRSKGADRVSFNVSPTRAAPVRVASPREAFPGRPVASCGCRVELGRPSGPDWGPRGVIARDPLGRFLVAPWASP